MGRTAEALAIQLDLAATNPEPDPYVFEELVALYTELGDAYEATRWQADLDKLGNQSIT
jgi:hypothetical protein